MVIDDGLKMMINQQNHGKQHQFIETRISQPSKDMVAPLKKRSWNIRQGGPLVSSRLNIIYYQLKKCTMKMEITQELPCICIKFDPQKPWWLNDLSVFLCLFPSANLDSMKHPAHRWRWTRTRRAWHSIAMDSCWLNWRPPAPSWRILHLVSSNRNDHLIVVYKSPRPGGCEWTLKWDDPSL